MNPEQDTLATRVIVALLVQSYSLLSILWRLLGVPSSDSKLVLNIVMVVISGAALVYFANQYLARSSRQGPWAVLGALNVFGWIALWLAFSEKLHPPRRALR